MTKKTITKKERQLLFYLLVIGLFFLARGFIEPESVQVPSPAVHTEEKAPGARSLSASLLERDDEAFSYAEPEPRPIKGRGNTGVDNFEVAKRLLPKVYAGRERTFYCDCPYEGTSIIAGQCSFTSKKPRGQRLEWEHVVPASRFEFREWREGDEACRRRTSGQSFRGRECARRVSAEFRRIEGDLYNLVPSVGEINQARSNHRMGILPHVSLGRFGDCPFKVEGRLAEPRAEVRGEVARIYQYMAWAYPDRFVMDREKKRLMEVWSRAHPVSDEEYRRARHIERLQGNVNPFVVGWD